MKHPDEHTLELYVLNADSVLSRRSEIEDHVRACAGCRALVAEISEFYTELDRELRTEHPAANPVTERSLMKRAADLAVWEERLEIGPPVSWGTPVKRLRNIIRRYPIAAAGATIAFTALAGLGLMAGYRELTRDTRPGYVALNEQSGFFEVYNRANDLLWRRLIPNLTIDLTKQSKSDMPRYCLFDLGADGSTEVLTPMTLQGEPPLSATGLHVFDGRGSHYDIVHERRVTFRGDPYAMPVGINGGSIIVADTTRPGGHELFVTMKNDRSPYAIVRLDRTGRVLGEYWHQGQFVGLYIIDIDGDGRSELIACGFNDVDDQKDLGRPVFVVLDPEKIVGTRESSASRGFGFEKSEAELYYVRLPLTEFNTTRRINAGVRRFRDHGESFVFLWGCVTVEGQDYEMDFVFSRSLTPLRVQPGTQAQQLFDREFLEKRLSTRLDDPYLEKLVSDVRFWDGKEWRPGPLRVDAPSPLSDAR